MGLLRSAAELLLKRQGVFSSVSTVRNLSFTPASRELNKKSAKQQHIDVEQGTPQIFEYSNSAAGAGAAAGLVTLLIFFNSSSGKKTTTTTKPQGPSFTSGT